MRLTRPLLAAALAGMVAGCAAQMPLDPSQRRAALLDAYAIAHGMARSCAESGHATVAVVLELRRLDERAYRLATAPGIDEDSTAEAVAALTSYAARQSDARP